MAEDEKDFYIYGILMQSKTQIKQTRNDLE